MKTDLFALGSGIYFIITGHEVFPNSIALKMTRRLSAGFETDNFQSIHSRVIKPRVNAGHKNIALLKKLLKIFNFFGKGMAFNNV